MPLKSKVSFIIGGLFLVPFAIIIGGRVPYFLLYVYLLTALVPLLHGFLGKLFIKGKLKLPEKELVAGEEIKISYEIENPLALTFPCLELENTIAYRLTGQREETIFFQLDRKESFYGEATIICRRRGLYKTGEVSILIRDIFNFYTLTKVAATPLSLKIYPKITPLKNFKVQASQHMGELIVNDPLFQDYSSLSDLRLYQEGDSFKKIHWKASAKNDTLMVKNFEERGDNEVVIVLDSYQGSYEGDREYWIEDKLVEIAASLIEYCLKENIKISLYYQIPNGLVSVKGDHSGYLKSFLDKLVLFHPTVHHPFHHEIERMITTLQQGSTLLLLTPRLNKELGAQGIRLKMKNFQPVYMVVGDEKENPDLWKKNKELAKVLEGEGIPIFLIDVKQDLRDILEGKYEKGA